MTSLTVRTASSSSSARHPRPFICPVPWLSLPNCYCDPEALPRGEGPSPTETGTVSSLCRVAGGPRRVLPALLPPCQSLWASSLLLQLSPGCQPSPFLEVGAGGPHPTNSPGQASTPHWSHLLLIIQQWNQGEGRQSQMGSFLILIPPRPNYPCPEYWGTPDSSRQCQHKSIHLRVTVATSHERFLVLLLPFQSPQAWVTVPTPHDCSDSTETGLFSNNILYSLPPSPGMA